MNTAIISNQNHHKQALRPQSPLDATHLLRQVFPELYQTDIETLSQTADYCIYEAGMNLCREGEVGTRLFILAQGEADVIVNVGGGHEVLVDTVKAIDYFGEMSLFGDITRMATVRAKTTCCALEINHLDFIEATNTNPHLLSTLLKQVIGHIRGNDRAVIRELNAKNAALQSTYTLLAEQEDLRAQFIATLSHELRTPLTSIQGFLGLINQGAIKGDSLAVAMDSITRNVDKMVGLTNNLLILYEMHPGKLSHEYLDLTDVLVKALNTVREMGEVDLTAVTLDIKPDLPKIYGDKRTLILSIRALIENAYKFTPSQPDIHVHVYRHDTEVAIAITDTGIGIPEEELHNIFEPFYRLETEGTTHLFPGMGVGLTIARFIIERHNGRINVVSAPGKGSTFTIYLPIRA